MVDDITVNPQPNADEETYHQYGFRCCERSFARADGIDGYLDTIYENFLNKKRLDAIGINDRIGQLRSEVLQEETKKNGLTSDQSLHNTKKEGKEKEINELELEKINIRKGLGENEDTVPFVIGAIITIFLTFFLFTFYSSTGYSAFYNIKPGNLSFINPNVWSDAKDKGDVVFLLVILFPIIFLSLGFAIHVSIENNKKAKAEGKQRNYYMIGILVFIAFVNDFFIGYKITKGIYINEFYAGLKNDEWVFIKVFSDPNFYLILVLGFVVYLIWGYLLNYVLSHGYLRTESEKMKLLIDNVNKTIDEKRKDLSDIIARLHQLESDITTCDNKILEKGNDIIGLENGVIPISIASLKSAIGEFMGGWQAYTNNRFDKKESGTLILEAIKRETNWLDAKIQSLNINK